MKCTYCGTRSVAETLSRRIRPPGHKADSSMCSKSSWIPSMSWSRSNSLFRWLFPATNGEFENQFVYLIFLFLLLSHTYLSGCRSRTLMDSITGWVQKNDPLYSSITIVFFELFFCFLSVYLPQIKFLRFDFD